jgi:hypothetical protein
MEVNPYESPRVGTPVTERPLGDTDAIRQLLVEIRDAQVETAYLLRQADLRQQRAMRLRWPFLLLGLAAPIVIFALMFFRQTQVRTIPATPFPPPLRAPLSP